MEVAQGLRKRGILIRYFGSQGGALQNYIRISSSLPWHTDRVIHALAQLLLPPVPRVASPPTPCVSHACVVSCVVRSSY